MGYCIAEDGTRLKDEIVKELILEEDFETAYFIVCKFITKRKLRDLHIKLIKHISRNKFTLDLAPRGFGKSTIGDIDYCITKILREPDIRIAIGSKTQQQAEGFVKVVKSHFESNDDLIRIFGELQGDVWTDKQFTVSTRKIIQKEATLTAFGASGAIVSKHFDVLLPDDIVGFENARTDTLRQKTKEWFYSSFLPTLEPYGELHALGTRYHPLDLYQGLIDSGNYSVQIQKAIKYRGTKNECSLWEDYFSLDKLKQIEGEAGKIIFAMQYQNEVELAKGQIFKYEYFKYYDEYIIRDGQVYVVRRDGDKKQTIPVDVFMGVDLAIAEKETADYFVPMVIGRDTENNFYILSYIKDRLSFNKQFDTIVKYGMLFPTVQRIGIESNAYQASLAQELKRTTTLPIIELKTTKDKVTRAMRRSVLFENGKVFIRNNMDDLVDCLVLFPDVEHDDLFDALDFAITSSEQKKVKVLDRKDFTI